jgi:ABC-type transport system involved in cytochrome c biogenesis permease component
MTGLGSLIQRELAIAARQTSTYRARLLSAVSVLALFLVISTHQRGTRAGALLFTLSSFLLFFQALFSGLRLTSDCLSEEKREGTLGLLFLTELRAGEIVLGKMAVRSLRGLYALIASLPVLCLCVLLGGITGIDAFIESVMIIVVMLFSLAVGVFVSSCATEDRAAFFGTFGLLLAFALIPITLWKTLNIFTGGRFTAFDPLLYLSPSYAYKVTPPTLSPTSNVEVRNSLLTLLASGACLVAAAAFQIRRFFVQFPSAPIAKLKKSRSTRGKHRPIPSAGPKSNPYFWLLTREKFLRKILWTFVILVPAFLLATKLLSAPIFVLYYGLYLVHVLWKTILAADAVRQLHSDFRNGALELLLSTPLPVEEIISAHTHRSHRMLFPGTLILMVANMILWDSSQHIEAPLLCGIVFIFLDPPALRWQGMLNAFSPHRYPAAILRTVTIVVGLPAVVFPLLAFTFQPSGNPDGLLVVWSAGCAVYNAVLIHRAKHRLTENFRLIASETQQSSKPAVSNLPKPIRWLLFRETTPG